MKKTLAFVFGVLFFVACGNAPKEEPINQEEVQKFENIEKELDASIDTLTKKTEETEAAIEALLKAF